MRARGCCRFGGAAGVAGVCRGTGEDSGSLPTKCSTKRIGCISLSPSLGADPARWHLSPQGGQPPVPRCPTPLDLTAASAYKRRLYPSPSFSVHPQVRLTSPPLPQPMFFSLVSLPPPRNADLAGPLTIPPHGAVQHCNLVSTSQRPAVAAGSPTRNHNSIPTKSVESMSH